MWYFYEQIILIINYEIKCYMSIEDEDWVYKCSKRESKININKSHSESKSNGIYITENRKDSEQVKGINTKITGR